MQRDLDRLAHMIEAAEAIASYLQGVDRQGFLDQPILQDAVLRRLTVVGEAANRVSSAVQAQAPNVPWRRIVGFRNYVIHEYQRVDWALVWDVVAGDLPELIAEVRLLATGLGDSAER